MPAYDLIAIDDDKVVLFEKNIDIFKVVHMLNMYDSIYYKPDKDFCIEQIELKEYRILFVCRYFNK